MDSDAPGHAGGQSPARGRLARMLAAGALTAAVGSALVASGGLSYAAAAFGKAPNRGPAAKQYDSVRPGWGCGDRNHVHTGPPGRQYRPTPPGRQYRPTPPGHQYRPTPPGHQYAPPPPGCTR